MSASSSLPASPPPSPPTPAPTPGAPTDEPVALLQLDAGDAANAASAVYREVRRGRRVVAVAAGGPSAIDRLAQALDAIGVSAARPDGGHGLLGGEVAIVAGPETAPTRPRPIIRPPLRVALAGCGVVGGGVAARLLSDPRFELVGVLVRTPAPRRDVSVPRDLLLTDPAALLAREPDVLVEAISDASTGLALIRAALARGVDVVSANKQAVGADLPGLLALATGAGARLAFSACVGGGAPLVETVRRARAHGRIVRIEGVLNGTCNYVLERLAEGRDFDDALAAARAAGFAEADASADLSGADAAAKLVILAHEAGTTWLTPGHVVRTPMTPGRRLSGACVRQIAWLDLIAGEAAVDLRPVDGDHRFAELPDEWNAFRIVTEGGLTFTARGRGAGRLPTVESVWSDLVDLSGLSPD